jgi:hypothetical protein
LKKRDSKKKEEKKKAKIESEIPKPNPLMKRV